MSCFIFSSPRWKNNKLSTNPIGWGGGVVWTFVGVCVAVWDTGRRIVTEQTRTEHQQLQQHQQQQNKLNIAKFSEEAARSPTLSFTSKPLTVSTSVYTSSGRVFYLPPAKL